MVETAANGRALEQRNLFVGDRERLVTYFPYSFREALKVDTIFFTASFIQSGGGKFINAQVGTFDRTAWRLGVQLKARVASFFFYWVHS